MARVGGLITVTLADAVFPVPPWSELTAPEMLFCTPSAVPLISTFTVQEVVVPAVTGAFRAPPLKLITLVFCIAVTVPPHELVKPFGVLIIKPEGKVSLKASCVYA